MSKAYETESLLRAAAKALSATGAEPILHVQPTADRESAPSKPLHPGVECTLVEVMRAFSTLTRPPASGPRRSQAADAAGKPKLSHENRAFVRRWLARGLRPVRLASGTDNPNGVQDAPNGAGSSDYATGFSSMEPQSAANPRPGNLYPAADNDRIDPPPTPPGSLASDIRPGDLESPTLGGDTYRNAPLYPRSPPLRLQPSASLPQCGIVAAQELAPQPEATTRAMPLHGRPANAGSGLDPAQVADQLEDPDTGEGYSPYAYADGRGGITIGAGLHILDKAAFRKLPLVFKGTNHQASDRDKDAEWDNIKTLYGAYMKPGQRNSGALAADAYKYVTKLEVDQAELRERTANIVGVLDRALAHRYSDFHTFPPAAQRAIFDMAYTLGMQGLKEKFPAFNAAVRGGNWLKASQESGRTGISPARNEYVRNLLLQAARSRPHGLR